MARIRTIKPEFFTSEDITSLTPLARLFYVSLWCESDREGRLEWKPGTFKLRYFPADQCEISGLAEELIKVGLIILYGAGDKTYADIPTFKEHQVINNRETPSTIPARVRTRQSGVLTRKSGREGKEGREGGSTEPPSDSTPPAIDQPAVVWIPLIDKTDYRVDQPMVDDWQNSFPAVDVLASLLRMRAWCNANPANKKTERGVNAFIVRWLGKEQDKGGGPRGPVQGGLLPGAI